MGPDPTESKWRAVCRVAEIPPGSGKEVVTEGPEGRRHVALLRSGDDVRAYLNVCPHQGRSLNWVPDEFLVGEDGCLVCPHHGASFDVSTGSCVDGPCKGDALETVQIEVREGTVYLREA